MHRLLVDTDVLFMDNPILPKSEANHLRVIRPKKGEQIELFDGCGSWRVFSVNGEGNLVASSSLSRMEYPQQQLTLFACITKGSRWDWTIEKATELGVTRIVPVISERTIVRIPLEDRAAKRDRWLRIAEDAARQSDAKWIPMICEAVDFNASLKMVEDTVCFIGALTNPPSPSLLSAASAPENQSRNMAVYIGPEGDFTPEELSALMKIAIPTSFGPTILRAETAAIFASSILAAITSR